MGQREGGAGPGAAGTKKLSISQAQCCLVFPLIVLSPAARTLRCIYIVKWLCENRSFGSVNAKRTGWDREGEGWRTIWQ